jgi:hypothetical protein
MRSIAAPDCATLHLQVAFDLNLGSAGDMQQLQSALAQAISFGSLQVQPSMPCFVGLRCIGCTISMLLSRV